ncbi:nucleotide pyrophosphohydrolase [Nautilia profundicola AmH]|uniref:Nucleotide pyrophosphohydrolase n=1 Tax=Nautilia profundicola (strain ATCC BAA-1463 / DSM 18972 / AmH) TaxID=598659 RepID=B9L709_NAUPA|nr:nucleotide pyrophosphohydrolase [Nautilia profundicola]ACM93188.1 nucleotide pyrophosphohydrolase [Nautilia profundicola AmH]
MNIKDMQRIISDFRDERDWKQFHTPKNLAVSISIEAGELLEHFQWKEGCENKKDISYEMADILAYLLLLADECSIDLEKAFLEKMEINKKKYPANKVKGSSKKYTAYES